MNKQQFIKSHLLSRSVLSYLLLPLSWLYALILLIRRLIFLSLPFLKFKSSIPLICIGNISSGGTGKTPFVIFLSRYLQKRGLKIAIITRGYKGDFENSNTLISNYHQVFDLANKAGDEAYLLSQKLPGVPVIVGRKRIRSIRILEEKFSELDYIILDDAFQYLKLNYFKTFVIFNGVSPFGNGFSLPAGILREPLFNTFFADYIVFNSYKDIPPKLNSYNKPILKVSYQVKSIVDYQGKCYTFPELAEKNLALMSAIGIPESFENTIKICGLSFTKHFIFPDHFDYKDPSTLQKIENSLHTDKIDFLLVTEKDQAKLSHINHKLPVLTVITEFDMEESGRLYLESL
jgi:tetraacyldisaccharide 4'-kinase